MARHDDDDYDRPRRRRRSYMRPHRGGLILAFGILGLVSCFIFGFIGWIMGRADLAAMAAGEMDPEGEGLTKAGTIMGMISVILGLLTLAVFGAIFAFAFAAGP